MGAACSTVLSSPLTTKRDFVERVLPAARAQSTPVRANATTFALRRVNGQVHSRAVAVTNLIGRCMADVEEGESAT